MLGAAVLTARADILANGNFADGTTHWRGDAHGPSDAFTQGILIQLDQEKWTKISQVFNTRENALDFSITYKTSSDCSLATGPSVGSVRKLSVPELARMVDMRFKNGIRLKPSSWLLMIVDPAENLMNYYEIQPILGSPDPQTVTGTIPKLAAHEEKTIYLAFPPGQGTITLLTVQLMPTAGPSAPAP